ncbi:SRPBCC domain-containing protein [Micromonospora sp. NPDC049049]|uniref:SRPBCC domain-containing protein n=1 Tax=Micromonospora sp. NPDC049049 TaxID=3155495 RepID=UPI0033D6DE19
MSLDVDGTQVTLCRDSARPSVRLRRRYPAPVAAVWRCLVEPDQVNAWWTPMTVELVPEAGAAMTFTWPGGDTDPGQVLAVDPPHLFAYTWGPDTLRWDLSAAGDGTDLTLLTTVADPGHIAYSAAGWHAGLDLLGDHLAGREVVPPGPDPAPPALVERYRRLLDGEQG